MLAKALRASCEGWRRVLGDAKRSRVTLVVLRWYGTTRGPQVVLMEVGVALMITSCSWGI